MQWSRCAWWFGWVAIAAGANGAQEAARGPASTGPSGGAEATAKARAWPGDTGGLVFLWQDASQANQIVSPGGEVLGICRAAPRGPARFGRFFDMLPAGGAFLAEGADESLLAACRRTGRLAIEAVLTPPERADDANAGSIVSFSGGRPSPAFALHQRGDRLVLCLRTGPGEANQPMPADLCPLAPSRPQHVVVSYEPGRTVCFVNGRQAAASGAIRGDLSSWTPQHLVFGDDWAGGRPWRGRLEGLALYSRFVGPEEAAGKYELYRPRLAARRDAERIVLLGRCVEVTPTPSLDRIHPYRRCLTFYTYEVRQVLQGKYGEKRILVGHWAILDGKALDLNRRKGQTYRLVVEPESDHPEMTLERKVMVQDELNAERFYDVQEQPSASGDRQSALGRRRPGGGLPPDGPAGPTRPADRLPTADGRGPTAES